MDLRDFSASSFLMIVGEERGVGGLVPLSHLFLHTHLIRLYQHCSMGNGACINLTEYRHINTELYPVQHFSSSSLIHNLAFRNVISAMQ